MTVKQRSLCVIMALAVLLTTLGAAGFTATARASEETLTLYSGRNEKLMSPILEEFTKDTGIKLAIRYGDTAEMAATILEEGDNSPADVFLAQDAGALGALAAEERLTVIPDTLLERVPAEFQSPDGVWVGVSGRARVLAYNTKALKADQLPTSILDLVKPEYKGRVAWAPTNASLQSQVTALRVLLGEEKTAEWLKGMVANETKVYSGNVPMVKDVADGVVEMAITNHYYIWQLRATTPDTAVAAAFFPKGDPGALVNVAGAGILTTSKKRETAAKLIDYLLSEKAQKYFAETTFEYPLIEGVALADGLTPLADLEMPEIDLSDLADLRGTLALLQETGVLP
ncbi:MAG TPA: iron ABC transporter substrate-binding protein [Aggregatilineales bacterium]|nr:iron ABC transporter substrate-binding protein [Aggregatilineales bacterium]